MKPASPLPNLDTDGAEFWRGFEVGANYIALSTIPSGRHYITTVLASNVENLSRICEQLGLDYQWHDSAIRSGCIRLYAARGPE